MFLTIKKYLLSVLTRRSNNRLLIAKRESVLLKDIHESNIILKILIKVSYKTLTRFRRTCSVLDEFVEVHRTYLAGRRYSKCSLYIEITEHEMSINITMDGEYNRKITDPSKQMSALGFETISVDRKFPGIGDHLCTLAVDVLRELRPFTSALRTLRISQEHVLEILSSLRRANHTEFLVEYVDIYSFLNHSIIKRCQRSSFAVKEWRSPVPIFDILEIHNGNLQINVPEPKATIHSIIWDLYRNDKERRIKSLAVDLDGAELFDEDSYLPPNIKLLWEAEEKPAHLGQISTALSPPKLHILETRRYHLLISQFRSKYNRKVAMLIFLEKTTHKSHSLLSSSMTKKLEFYRRPLPEKQLWETIFNFE